MVSNSKTELAKDSSGASSKPEAEPSPTPGDAGFQRVTSSRLTQTLGGLAATLLAGMLFFALYVSGPDVSHKEAVRLMYIHLPSVAAGYTCFLVTLVASAMFLKNRTAFWDVLAGAAAELGVVFTGLMLATGMLWGKPSWGVYWAWDPRLISTAVMFITYLGYLAIRQMELPRDVRSQRAAVFGIVSFVNVIVVRYAVQWWRSLHQGQTFGVGSSLAADLYEFTTFLGVVTFLAIGAWLLVHRFRVGWLQHEAEQSHLETAIKERRAEALVVDLRNAESKGKEASEASQ